MVKFHTFRFCHAPAPHLLAITEVQVEGHLLVREKIPFQGIDRLGQTLYNNDL